MSEVKQGEPRTRCRIGAARDADIGRTQPAQWLYPQPHHLVTAPGVEVFGDVTALVAAVPVFAVVLDNQVVPLLLAGAASWGSPMKRRWYSPSIENTMSGRTDPGGPSKPVPSATFSAAKTSISEIDDPGFGSLPNGPRCRPPNIGPP
ncbi:hypothetical protein [Nocardia alni]|uniref:hypothetical protein n=1 Tax=Nocardia alni TaxID=2815723 RepID=UPI001C243EE4|nr:hypothetical protein [Nocardia alni]